MEYLTHEGMVQGVGVFFLISGTICLAVAAIAALAVLKGDLPNGEEIKLDPNGRIIVTQELAWFLVIFYGIAAPIGLILGQCLRNLLNWARITTGILTVPGLLGFPVGTLVSGIILYLLFNQKSAYVCSLDYKEVIEATPQIHYRTPVVMKVLVGLFLFLVVIGIAAFGFTLLNPGPR